MRCRAFTTLSLSSSDPVRLERARNIGQVTQNLMQVGTHLGGVSRVPGIPRGIDAVGASRSGVSQSRQDISLRPGGFCHVDADEAVVSLSGACGRRLWAVIERVS